MEICKSINVKSITFIVITLSKSQTLYNLFKLAEFCVYGEQSHPTIIYELIYFKLTTLYLRNYRVSLPSSLTSFMSKPYSKKSSLIVLCIRSKISRVR